MSPAPGGRGEDAVAVTVEDGVAVVTLRRPPHNLLTEVALRRSPTP